MQLPRGWTIWIATTLALLSLAVFILALLGNLTPLGAVGSWLVPCSAIALGASVANLWYQRQNASNALHRAMAEQLLPQLLVAENCTIISANAPFAALVGSTVSALVGLDIRDFISGKTWQALLASTPRQAPEPDSKRRSSPSEQTAVALGTVSDTQHWVLLRAQRTPADNQLLLLTCWDHTPARTRMVRQAKLASGLKKLVHQTHDIALWLSADGRIISCNDRSRLVLGKSIQGLQLTALLGEEQADRFVQARQECLHKGGSVALRRLALQPVDRDKGLLIDAKLQPSDIDSAALVLTGSSVNHFVVSEEKLRSSEKRLERVFQNSPDAIAIVRLDDCRIIDCNEGLSKLLGHQREEAVNRTLQTLKLWEEDTERQLAVAQLMQNRTGVTIESRLVRKDGVVLHAEIFLRLVQIEEEDCVLIMARDISARVAAEAARAASEEKFLRTFENSPDGIAILRKDGAIIKDINPALVNASGYDRAHFLNRSLFEVGVMANLSEMNPSDLMLKQDQKFENIEMTFRTRDNELIPAMVSVKQFELNGEDHLITIVRDVRELRTAQARVARSEERFRGAFEKAQLAMILINLDGQIFQTNKFAQDLLSYTESDLSDMHISRLIPQEERVNLKNALSQLVHSDGEDLLSERRMLCQNGLEIWTNFQIVLQRDPSGQNSYFIIQAADVTDIKLSQRRMERMAFYDTLTDLANRRLFQDRLQHAIEHCQRSQHKSALLYLDLDQFKRVNDTLGHEAGDSLLREVALRLTECVRTEDTVGRTGGDEFTVLLFDIENGSDAGTVAEKILESLREPIAVSGHNLVVTTSIGVAIIPNDGRDANVVMKNADLAMYRAKERGRNNYQFFSEDMNTKAILRLRTENELREGLVNGEFVLHHQPKYRISDGRIVGVESLVRWNHPTRGFLPPSEFIPIAEETGAIVNLGSWVIEAACQAGREFANLAGGDFTTAVNISPRQFRDPNLISHIRRCLRTSGLPANLLQIEITETMLMHDVEAASVIVARLHELGTYLAIDDFGTGYSSLNYLKKFPIQTVKVDRSFVTDIPHNSDDMAITAAVIAMAHRLNMDVVAEGVETQGQLQFLAENDCEYAQGYLFSKPISAAEVQQLIRAERAPKARPKALPKAPRKAQRRPATVTELATGSSLEK